MENLGLKKAAAPDASFWRGKRVLLTGHTGFKGAWLAFWLQRMGASVTGIGLAPATTPNLHTLAGNDQRCASHYCDIRDQAALAALVRQARPEIVIHMAAQALVRAGYRDPVGTFATNVQGTVHVLDALRGLDGVRAVVAVTTDKVYLNRETPFPYREADPLGGHDPYSASKAAAEIAVACYRDAFLAEQGVGIATARAGNVIGGGDWSEDRLLPDAVRAWNRSETLEVRRPEAVRPFQHVLEPLSAYLVLAERLAHTPALAGAYNFGPLTHEASTVRDVVELARAAFGTGEVRWGDGSEGPHEAGWLALEVAHARHALGVRPRWSVKQAVTRSIAWYRDVQDGMPAAEAMDRDIDGYQAALAEAASP